MKRSVAFMTAAALGLGAYSTAHGYSGVADVTFAWAPLGTVKGWTSSGTNAFPDPNVAGNNTQVAEQTGNNSTGYINADFAIASDYGAGTADDCVTLISGYETISLRKYACRQSDTEAYYNPVYNPAPVSDAGPGAAASGFLTVTDTTLTGTLTVISTTDEPTGATTTFASGLRTSNSPGNGFDGYNVRTADGSPFGNVWYGITTTAQLTVNLTGTFTATDWTIDGGAVTFNDPGFGCQQGGFGGDARGTLCSASGTGGGFQNNGGHLSWGMDTDGAGTGTTVATPIDLRNEAGNATIASLSGVLAHLTLDGGGNLATTDGEIRYAAGSAGGGCLNHIRWGGDTDAGVGVSIGISCGTLTSTSLTISGTVVPPDTDPDQFSFVDQLGVALSSPITSVAVTITGINTAAPISVAGGDYSIGCTGTFTNVAGTIDPNQTVCVQHTSAATPGTGTDTILTVGTVSDTFTSTTATVDTTPDPFTFGDLTGVTRSTEQVSNQITVSGIDAPAAISVTGGEYAVNGGAYTAAAGTVNNGDTVTVRHTSSAAFSTAVDTVLDIGGVPDTFTSTTEAEDTTPDAFTFTAQSDVPLGSLRTSNQITVAGINSPAAISVTNGQYSVNGGAYTAAAGTVDAGDTVTVQHTSSNNFSTDVDTDLDIGGVTATFTSTTIAADTTPDAFSFTPATDVELDTVVESNAITVSGINSPSAISVTGGEYSIDGGAYTSAAGTVNNGQSVTVRHTSASEEDTDTDTTLTIGGVSDTFTSTTLSAAPPPGLRADDGGSSLDALILALLGVGAWLRRRPR